MLAPDQSFAGGEEVKTFVGPMPSRADMTVDASCKEPSDVRESWVSAVKRTSDLGWHACSQVEPVLDPFLASRIRLAVSALIAEFSSSFWGR